jgi:hypothetical protein
MGVPRTEMGSMLRSVLPSSMVNYYTIICSSETDADPESNDLQTVVQHTFKMADEADTLLQFIVKKIFNLRLGLPSGLLPSAFPTNIPYAFLVSPIRSTCPAHLILSLT